MLKMVVIKQHTNLVAVAHRTRDRGVLSSVLTCGCTSSCEYVCIGRGCALVARVCCIFFKKKRSGKELDS